MFPALVLSESGHVIHSPRSIKPKSEIEFPNLSVLLANWGIKLVLLSLKFQDFGVLWDNCLGVGIDFRRQ